MEEKEKSEKTIQEKLLEESEKLINKILENGIEENINFLDKIVDIRKDIKEEEYMRYNGYNEGGYGAYSEGGYSEGGYGARGVPGTGRRGYREGSYGRRGVPGSGRGRYRGEEMMDEMMYHYGNYSDGMSSYGADQETMKSFKYMLKAFKDYYKHLKQEASSQEEVQMLEDVAREISEM